MSTTIDNRVVEMQFDNRHFEKNVATSMSTLDKLKKSLNLTGAAKGLEDVSASAKKVDLSGLSRSADTVGLRFNAMYTIADQALRNITNSAMAAGKRIVSALTIDPVKTGFQEYETQINSVQTILANTESKGTTIDQVNEALEQLNTYADKTIYNFTEMTRNIGTFTAAGVDLDTSVNAIQGIANLAAVSGSTSQQASTAMYQLSQALSSGTVKLMDWNSVVNAGMGGQVFQDALKETARVHGVAIDQMIEEQGSFRETLSDGWLTSEILTETLMKFTMATEGLTEAEIAANREKLRGMGYTDEQINGIFKLGNTATNAATKVKTFTQLWDVMKESAQSGWAQTWKLLIGDFEEAKNLLTPLADLFTGAIGKMSEARNAVLGSALGKNFVGLWEKISGVIKPVGDAFEKVEVAVEGVTKTLEEHEAVVDSVIRGDWGNYLDRYNALADAGYDWVHVQNMVNEKLGNSYRRTSAYTEALAKQSNTQDKTAESTEAASKTSAKYIAYLTKMSDEQLRNRGYTDEQIAAFRELAEVSDKLGIPIEELVEKMDEIDGRWLLINSFKNAGQGIITIIKAIGKAWSETFDGISGDDLFNIVAAIHKFSTKLVVGEKTADNLTRTLKGLFAILDIITTITGGGLKIAFKVVSGILSYFNMDLLETTARIGDAVVSFRDWIDENLGVSAALNFLIPKIASAAKAISGFIDTVKNSKAFAAFTGYLSRVSEGMRNLFGGISGSDQFKKLVSSLSNAGKVFKEIFEALKDSDNIPRDIIAGLVNGLKNGVGPVIKAVFELAKMVIEGICEVLGIHSPSTVFMAIGGFIIAGLVLGLQNGSGSMMDTIKSVFDKIVTFVKNLDFGAIFATATMVGMLMAVSKIANALEALAAPFEGFGDFMEDLGKGVKKVSGAISANLKAKALQTIATSLLMLVGAVAVLAFVPAEKLWGAIGALLAIATIVGALTVIIGKFGPKDVGELTKFAISLLGMAGALLILSISLKMLSGLSMDEVGAAVVGMGAIVTSLILLMVFTSSIDKKIDGLGGTFIKMTLAMLLMVGVMKAAAGLNETELKQGSAFIIGFGLLVAGFMWATKLLDKGDISSVGGMLLKISAAMLLMVGVMKLAGGMNEAEIKQGGLAIIAFSGIIVGLMAATRLLGKSEVKKIGSAFMGIAGAMLMMAFVVRILGGMDAAILAKGTLAVIAFGGIITGLIAATKLASDKEIKGLAGTLMAISVAIGIMALVATLLGFLSLPHLAKGVIAVSIMAAMMALMIHVTKGAQDCKGNLIVLTVAIGVMAAAIAALAMITDQKKLTNAVLALSSVMAMFTVLIHVAGRAQGSIGPLIVMTVAVGLLGGLLYLLADLPAKSLIPAAAALSALILSISAAMLVVSKAGPISAKALIAIGVMTVVMGALGGILYLLKGMTAESAITTAGSLSILLIALTGAIVIISKAGPVSTMALIAIGVMTVVMGALGGILYLLRDLSPESAITSVVSLTVLIGVLLGAMAILNVIGGVSTPALAAVGVLTLVMAALAGILYMMQDMPIESTLANAASLSVLLLALSGACAIVSLIPAASAISGATGLAAFIGIMAAVIAAAGALAQIPGFNELIADGGETLGLVGKALGNFVGSIVGGFAAGVTSGLPEIGQHLSDFMTNVAPFIEGVKSVDSSVLEGTGYLAGAIAALAVADLIAGIASLVNLGGTFADLGSDLSQFMVNATPFIAGASMLNADMIAGVKSLAETVLILSAANVIDGLGKLLGGGKSSISAFGAQLPSLGINISQFAANLGTFTEDQASAIRCATTAIKDMATAADMIPNEGGWAAKILGENSIATFGSYLPALGTNLASFVKNLGTFTDAQVTTVGCASDAIVKMADAASKIPNEGGWAAKILGDNSLATFGSQLPALGTNLASFVKNLGTFTDAQVATVDAAGKAIVAMATASASIDGQAEWAKKIFGDNSLSKFGTEMAETGKSIAAFVTNLGTFGDDKITTVTNAVRAINAFTALANADLKNAKANLSGFGDKLPDFATNIASFATTMGNVSASVTTAVSTVNKLLGMIKDIAAANVGAMKTFASSLGTLGGDAVNKFIGAFTSETAKTNVKTALVNLMAKAVEGIKSKENAVKTAGENIAKKVTEGVKAKESDAKTSGENLIKKVTEGVKGKEKDAKTAGENLAKKVAEGVKAKESDVKTAAEGLADTGVGAIETEGEYSDWKDAGKYLVKGFAKGITEWTFYAEAKAAAMAAAALAAAEEELGIQSPSKEGYGVGRFFGMGFTNAIGDWADKAYDTSAEMANYAKNGLSNAIAKVRDVIESDMDTQPTIRPVLDLSAVEAGAGTIGGLFGNSSVGVLANVRGISSMMNQNRQNGVNDDVVYELKKLRGELGNVGGTQYNINGVTYDDGSNITDAVKTIVRAARIERRV